MSGNISSWVDYILLHPEEEAETKDVGEIFPEEHCSLEIKEHAFGSQVGTLRPALVWLSVLLHNSSASYIIEHLIETPEE